MAAGLIVFLIYKKKSQNQITNGSLGVSMTGKTEWYINLIILFLLVLEQ